MHLWVMIWPNKILVVASKPVFPAKWRLETEAEKASHDH
jgi:hypothetical protein